MFRIYDGREAFYQWDIDRKLIVKDETVKEVHFCNKTDECSLVCEVYEEDGLRVANVPNVLLQTTWRINVYAYDEKYTKYSARFEVIPRTKPEDYIYTEEELKEWEELEERVAALEEGGESVDLSNYYTKGEVDKAIEEAGGGAETPTFYDIGWNRYSSYVTLTEETKKYLEDINANYFSKPGDVSNIRLVDNNNPNRYFTCCGACVYRSLDTLQLYFLNTSGDTIATDVYFNDDGTYKTHDSTTQNVGATPKDWCWVENWWGTAVSLQQAGTYQHIKIVGYYGWDTNDSFIYELSTSFNNTFNEEQGAKYYVAEPYQSERGSLRYYWNNEGDGLYFYDENGNIITDITVLGFYYWG